MSYRAQNVVPDNLSSNFSQEQIEFITKMCSLDCVYGLIGKYKLPISV